MENAMESEDVHEMFLNLEMTGNAEESSEC